MGFFVVFAEIHLKDKRRGSALGKAIGNAAVSIFALFSGKFLCGKRT